MRSTHGPRRVRNLHGAVHGAAAAMQRLAASPPAAVTLEPDGAAQMGGPAPGRVCHICQRELAKYTCPRCQSPYCGVECYKEHGAECTEGFFRDQVIGELKNDRPDDDARQQVASLLAQDAAARTADAEMLDPDAFNPEDALEEAAALLQRVDLSDDDRVAQALAALTEEQQQSFLRAVSAGQLGEGAADLRPWIPWWNTTPAAAIHRASSSPSARGAPLISEVLGPEPEPEPDDFSDDFSEPEPEPEPELEASTLAAAGSDAPPLPTMQLLPPLTSLVKGTPSPVLSVHMLDLLYAYVYCKQLYNGDWGSSALDAADVAQCALQLSLVLADPADAAATLHVATDAINSSLEHSLAPSVLDSAKFSVDVLEGVIRVLKLGHGPLRAIYDLHSLFQRAEEGAKANKTSSPTKEAARAAKRARKQTSAGLRKLWFFVVWCADIGGEDGSCMDWLQLGADVAQQAESLQAAATTGEELRSHITRPVISEAPDAGPVRSVPAAASAAAVEAQTERRVKLAKQEEEPKKQQLQAQREPEAAAKAGQPKTALLQAVPGLLSPGQLTSKLWPTKRTPEPVPMTPREPEPEPEPQPEPEPEPQADDAANPWVAKRNSRQKRLQKY